MLLIVAFIAALASNHILALSKLPNIVFGLYKSANNCRRDVLPDFESFAKLLGAANDLNPLYVEFYCNDADNFIRFYFYPNAPTPLGDSFTTELSFKLGQTEEATIKGREIKYLFTADGEVVHINYYEKNGSRNYSIDAKFDQSGIQSILGCRFQRILPAFTEGAFTNNPDRTSSETRDRCNRFAKLPKALFSWNDRLQVGLQGDRSDGVHLIRTFVHPYLLHQSNFTFGATQQVPCSDGYAKSVNSITESTLEKTVMRIEVDDPRCPAINEIAFNLDGFNFTAVINGTKHICGVFEHIVPWFLQGNFVRRRDSYIDQQWANFIQGYEDYFYIPEFFNISQKGNQYHINHLAGKSDTIFQLNVPQEMITPNGKLIKYIASTRDIGVRFDNEIVMRNVKYSVFTAYGSHGLTSTFVRGNLTARQHYDQIVPPAVFGTFESVGEDTKEYEAFASAMGTPELLNRTYVEFIKGADGISLITQLVQPSPKFDIDYIYPTHYMEFNGEPWIMSDRGDFAKPERQYRMTVVIHPAGFTAYYVYGEDAFNRGEKIATRQFQRKGPPVPI